MGFVDDMRLGGKLRPTTELEMKQLPSKPDRPDTLTPQEWNRITDSLLNLSSIVSEKQSGGASGKEEPIVKSEKQRYS